MKLIQPVKIALSFLHAVSNLFYFIILSLLILFYIWLSKNFWKPSSKNGEEQDVPKNLTLLLAKIWLAVIEILELKVTKKLLTNFF